jgi:hypothetical protein
VHLALTLWSALCAFGGAARRRFAGEAGEGIISTVIAILIVALIGLGVWIGMSNLMDNAQQRAEDAVNDIR